MRDILLLLALALAIVFTFRYRYAGVLVWAWLSLMIPQSMVYSFLAGASANVGIALQTLVLWLIQENKELPRGIVPRLMMLFLIWFLINSAVAPYPEWSAARFSITIKTYVFIFLCFFAINSKARILAMVWVIIVSLGYYGVKGGGFTILTGGHFHVIGSGGIYHDNNQLALAIAMQIPLVLYLLENVQNNLLKAALGATILLEMVSVLGSYSRGGFIALSVTLLFIWIRSRHKLLYLIIGVAIGSVGINLMPPEFYSRIDSIGDLNQDASFMGRVQAWQVCFYYALDHFPFGTGFDANYHPAIYNYYFPGAVTHVAHNIFFQVLGDHGFLGFILYVLIAAFSLRNARVVRNQCRSQPDLEWAVRLATALEVAQVAFYVGGFSLSTSYWDGILIVQVLTSNLRAMTEPKLRLGTMKSPSVSAGPDGKKGVTDQNGKRKETPKGSSGI